MRRDVVELWSPELGWSPRVVAHGSWAGRCWSCRRAREHPSARELAGRKGLRVETDLWGHDVPHDWPSWRAQPAHHLPRFV